MTPEAPPRDPNLDAQKEAAATDATAALQTRLQMDTSSIMARYGAATALAAPLRPTSVTPIPLVGA